MCQICRTLREPVAEIKGLLWLDGLGGLPPAVCGDFKLLCTRLSKTRVSKGKIKAKVG